MPIHDWTRVSVGTFHDFHAAWITHLKEALNEGLLPDGFYALAEQQARSAVFDVLTLATPSDEPIAVGIPLPDMPLFLDEGFYINVPLESTYQAAYRGMPEYWRRVIEGEEV